MTSKTKYERVPNTGLEHNVQYMCHSRTAALDIYNMIFGLPLLVDQL